MADIRDTTGKNPKFSGTRGLDLPTGTTGERNTSYGSGTLRFNSTTGLMEYYTGTDWKAVDSPPTITQFTIDGGADVTSGIIDSQAGGNATIEVKGSLFDTTGAVVTFVGESGSNEIISVQSITRNSSNLITVTVARSDFDNTNEPYTLKVTNGSGLAATLTSAISADTSPSFATASGGIGTINEGATDFSGLSSIAATDADGDTVTHTISAGALPSGITLNTNGTLTGTEGGGAATYNFTVQAATTNATVTRAFSLIVQVPPSDGSTPSLAGRSCKTIFDLGPSYQGSGNNGLYYITNYGTISAQQHYCLMDSSYSSGGWTLLYAGSSSKNDWGGSNYHFNLNNAATPSPTTLYARNRSGTFTPTGGDKFMMRREDNNDYLVHTVGTWQAGSSWAYISQHATLSWSGSTVNSSGQTLSGIVEFECCAQAGGCFNNGGDLCGFGKGSAHGCYNGNPPGGDTCYGGSWAHPTCPGSTNCLTWGPQGNIEGTYVSYWFRRDSAGE